MTLIITTTRITSDKCGEIGYQRDGLWHVTAYPGRSFDRNQAITAMALAEIDAAGPVTDLDHALLAQAWRQELGLEPLTNPPDFNATTQGVTGTPTAALCCLHCGNTDDIYETLVTIDERTSEYALECGLCHGVWAQ